MEGTDARFSAPRSLGTMSRERRVTESPVPRAAARARIESVRGSRPSRPLMPRIGPVIGLLALAAALLAAATHAPWSQATGPPGGAAAAMAVVQSNGGDLAVDGEPWRPVGYNDYRLTEDEDAYLCDVSAGGVDEEQLGARLDRVRAVGANVVRTWFFQAHWDPDGDGEGSWQVFDRVLEAAAERGLRVIPVLANHWADCEAGAPEKDLSFYSDGFRRPYGGAALSYLDYAERLASRYADSGAIAYWQLVNEPEAPVGGACSETEAAAALAGFASEASAAIRAVDQRHLISLGTIGGGQCGTAGDSYAAVHEAVDLCEVHVYEETSLSATDVAARATECAASGKPTIAGEIGVRADLDAGGAASGVVDEGSLENRADTLRSWLDPMLAEGLDGFLVWQLGEGSGDSYADPYAVGPCDPAHRVIARYAGAAEAPADEGCADGTST